MIDLSIIIISYNTKDLLLQCLGSIKENISKKLSYETIVVDNNSSDESVEMVKKDFRQVNLIENKENLGFSKANNIGVKLARGRYVLFLNSDTKIIQKHTLEEMVAFMDFHKDAGAATCWVQMPNGEIDDACHRGFPTPWNALCHFSGLAKVMPHSEFFNGYNLAWKDLGKVHEIDALAGAFMIVRHEAGEQVGWWDEDYFFYGEDLDFCFELKEHDWRIYFVPSTRILHYKGVSSGIKGISKDITTADAEGKKRITKARFDAMRIFYRKHYVKKYPSWVTWVVMKGVDVKMRMAMKDKGDRGN